MSKRAPKNTISKRATPKPSTATPPEQPQTAFHGLSDEEINALPIDDVIDRVFRDLEAAPPLLSMEDFDTIEQYLGDVDERMSRRAALASLTKSGAEITKTIRTDRELATAFAAVEVAAREHAKRFQELANLINHACMRITLAMCYLEDPRAVYAEVDAEFAEAVHGDA